MFDELLDRARENVFLVAVITVLAAMVFGFFLGFPRPLDVEAQQDTVLLAVTWEQRDNVHAIQIQGRSFGEPWTTVAFTWSDRGAFVVPIPPGASEWRIRGWTSEGPLPWSRKLGPYFTEPPPEDSSRKTS